MPMRPHSCNSVSTSSSHDERNFLGSKQMALLGVRVEEEVSRYDSLLLSSKK